MAGIGSIFGDIFNDIIEILLSINLLGRTTFSMSKILSNIVFANYFLVRILKTFIIFGWLLIILNIVSIIFSIVMFFDIDPLNNSDHTYLFKKVVQTFSIILFFIFQLLFSKLLNTNIQNGICKRIYQISISFLLAIHEIPFIIAKSNILTDSISTILHRTLLLLLAFNLHEIFSSNTRDINNKQKYNPHKDASKNISKN